MFNQLKTAAVQIKQFFYSETFVLGYVSCSTVGSPRMRWNVDLKTMTTALGAFSSLSRARSAITARNLATRCPANLYTAGAELDLLSLLILRFAHGTC